ncbi:tryptophan--tRNA ligase, partial [Candidatus Gracilibacteria bacterium]|nr:tryptophan--tRNA ligase [Candidatus Gracilibacteria bacterium]
YGNTIDIFAEEKVLTKQIMGIVTASIPLEDPKDPNSCNVFNLYKLIASKEETKELEEKYLKGGFGYGDAKKTLSAKLLDYFAEAREKYNELLPKKDFVAEILNDGSARAKLVASATLDAAKERIGYK